MNAWTIFISNVQQWGSFVVSVVLVPLVVYLISQIQKNSAADAKRAEELKEYVSDQVEKLEKEFQKKIEDHDRRIACLESDSLKKEEFYQAISGWRTEVNRLSDLITTQFFAFTERIIELWKGKGKE